MVQRNVGLKYGRLLDAERVVHCGTIVFLIVILRLIFGIIISMCEMTEVLSIVNIVNDVAIIPAGKIAINKFFVR